MTNSPPHPKGSATTSSSALALRAFCLVNDGFIDDPQTVADELGAVAEAIGLEPDEIEKVLGSAWRTAEGKHAHVADPPPRHGSNGHQPPLLHPAR